MNTLQLDYLQIFTLALQRLSTSIHDEEAVALVSKLDHIVCLESFVEELSNTINFIDRAHVAISKSSIIRAKNLIRDPLFSTLPVAMGVSLLKLSASENAPTI